MRKNLGAYFLHNQAHWEGGVEGKLPQAPRRLGAPPSFKNIKYTRMCHSKKKNSKIWSLEESRENVTSGPTVALNGPVHNLWRTT